MSRQGFTPLKVRLTPMCCARRNHLKYGLRVNRTLQEDHMLKAPKGRPRVAGLGLIALDVVLEGKNSKPKYFGGGTCGNVHVILSYLGWSVAPIARLDKGFAGDFVRADFHQW